MRRLSLLFSLALVTGLATAIADAQRRTAGFPSGTVVDLSYPFDSSTVYWPTAETFHLEKDFEGTTEQGYYYSAYRYSAAEHGGTHIDAPVHFAKGRNTVDEIPVEQLIGSGIVVDVTRQCVKDRDYLVNESDFKNWERRNGKIAAGTIVLLIASPIPVPPAFVVKNALKISSLLSAGIPSPVSLTDTITSPPSRRVVILSSPTRSPT